MNTSFSVGNRVKVSESHHWAKSASGVIVKPPDYVVEISDGWQDIFREVESLKGSLIFYWIKFDEPQLDADGDGPYHMAEIDSDYLELNR